MKEYATEVDVEVVRRSVRAIGRCAIKLERASERCINVLLELIQTKVNYTVQEGIIVIKVSIIFNFCHEVYVYNEFSMYRIFFVSILIAMKALLPHYVKIWILWMSQRQKLPWSGLLVNMLNELIMQMSC